MNTPIYLSADFYKTSHREQYPEGTTRVYSVLTPRSNKWASWSEGVVVFGIQYFIKEYLIKRFNDEFFNQPKDLVVKTYRQFISATLGVDPDTSHLETLHDLGYLPLKIRVLPEGTFAPIATPIMTIENTTDDSFWLTNFIETILSTTIWNPITSATIAREYRNVLENYATRTGSDRSAIDYQAHDFSMRGMSSEQSAVASSMGHLLYFKGTDTIPAIFGVNEYYHAPLDATTATSIPATEHSVMASYGQANEKELFKHFLTDIYPTGIFSVVSDTWDFWKVITEYLPELKDEILARDGKLVIRPDSGDPVKIITGDEQKTGAEGKGLIEVLWDIFGGTINEKGYKVLDPHIGAIYGDSITVDRAKSILKRLEAKGFASSNIVFGVGSFTYQYNTRDTFGFAVKATHVVVNGEERKIFKDPKTDDGTKRSQRGRVVVMKDNDVITWRDNLSIADEKELDKQNLLVPVFENGQLIVDETLADLRQRV